MLSELLIFCVGVGGLFFLSNATIGVGIICFACLLGIVQRLALARTHHAELKKLLTK